MNLTLTFSILAIYLAILLVIGYYSYRNTTASPEDYFMASRSFGTFVIAMSVFATNMTAVYMVGAPGMAYRMGLGMWGYMALTSAIGVSITFATLGMRAWIIGKAYGYITTSEMVTDRFKSDVVNIIFFIYYLVFITGYLVTAIIGGGAALEALTGGAVSYATGSLVMVLVTIAYTSLGGMRGTSWTNVFQGIVFMGFAILAFFIIGKNMGGINNVMGQILQNEPQFLAREGIFTWKQWVSWLFIPSLAVICFPHCMIRLMTAKDSIPVRNYTILYPILIFISWLPVIYIGLWGRVGFPGLTGTATDSILPMMAAKFMPGALAAVALAGIAAAIMSSMDAMLLTVSSMFTRDILSRYTQVPISKQVSYGRVLVIAVGLISWFIALQRPATIFQVAGLAFTGFIMLLPTWYLAMYWKKVTTPAVIASLVVVGVLMPFYQFTPYLKWSQFGFMPNIPLLIINFAILFIVSSFTKPPEGVDKWFSVLDGVYNKKPRQVGSDRNISV